MPLSARSRSSTSPVSSSGEHVPFTSPHGARHVHSSSNDSSESLRNLELTDGPMVASTATKHTRQRSFSFSAFDFQADLLPLSTTVGEGDTSFVQSPAPEKSISVIQGTRLSSSFASRCCWMVERQVSDSWLDCRCVILSWFKLIHESDRHARLAPEYCRTGICSTFP